MIAETNHPHENNSGSEPLAQELDVLDQVRALLKTLVLPERQVSLSVAFQREPEQLSRVEILLGSILELSEKFFADFKTSEVADENRKIAVREFNQAMHLFHEQHDRLQNGESVYDEDFVPVRNSMLAAIKLLNSDAA
jgi:hypothetical protein